MWWIHSSVFHSMARARSDTIYSEREYLIQTEVCVTRTLVFISTMKSFRILGSMFVVKI